MAFGLFNIWQGEPVSGPAPGNPAAENPGNTGNTNTGGNGSSVIEGNGESVNTKIVCLGDSFTIGYPGNENDSWPTRLKSVLKVEVVNAGKTFQNTSDLLERFDQDVVGKKPGRVVIFAGVGDALREKTLEEYQKNVKALVDKAEANHIKPILALPIPFPGTDTLYKAYREWEIAFAQEKKITILDFKGVLFDSEDKILRKYSDDGKYPNKDGYAAMGDYAAQVLQ